MSEIASEGDSAQDDTTDREEGFRQSSVNPRVRFLKLSALVKGRAETLGATPPFCPGAPTLLRATVEEGQEVDKSRHRRKSSLSSVLILSSYSTSPITGMPHSTNMPHCGFQALILCGPGIGLSTFTSVPNDFPKALINVANRPMVWYVLDWCYRMGVTDITLVTPPASEAAIAAALAQNPYLTSLPSPSPDLLAPSDLDHTTPTAALLRLPEVQAAITSDFLLLPCDLICDVPGETFLETYLTSLGGLGGVEASSASGFNAPTPGTFQLGGERSGRRGGLSVWYNTDNREESVKGEECDFMGTTKLEAIHEPPRSKAATDNETLRGVLRKLVWAMPISELQDKCQADKSWKIRQSLLSKYGALKCLTKFRDSHIYLFPYWVKDFARLNEDFESVSEDLVGTWAKTDWRKSSYRAQCGAKELFGRKRARTELGNNGLSIEEEVDFLSLSSTQTTRGLPSTVSPRRTAQLASRVQANLDDSILSPDDNSEGEIEDGPPPQFPPILSYVNSSEPAAPLIRRVDTTPLLLSVSLLLAKIPALDDASASKICSPFAHTSKFASSATKAQRTTVNLQDTLVDANTTVEMHCVIKSSVIGSSVKIGPGARLTNCLVMDGAVIGEKCELSGTVIGKKAKIGKGCKLQNCEVQDANAVAAGSEYKGEKLLVGGLEDEMDDEGDFRGDDIDDGDGEGISLD